MYDVTIFTDLHFCSLHGDNNEICFKLALSNLFSNVCVARTPKHCCDVNKWLKSVLVKATFKSNALSLTKKVIELLSYFLWKVMRYTTIALLFLIWPRLACLLLIYKKLFFWQM